MKQKKKSATLESVVEKTVSINGQKFDTGYGYSITNNNFFRPAIENFSDDINEDFIPSTDVDVEVIKNQEDINGFFTTVTDSSEISGNVTIYETSNQLRETIEHQINKSSNQLLIVARIRIKNQEFTFKPSEDTNFTSRAFAILESRGVPAFVKRYRTMFVYKQIKGANIYYLYSYSNILCLDLPKGR